MIRPQPPDPTSSLGALDRGWDVQNGTWPVRPEGQPDFTLVMASIEGTFWKVIVETADLLKAQAWKMKDSTSATSCSSSQVTGMTQV